MNTTTPTRHRLVRHLAAAGAIAIGVGACATDDTDVAVDSDSTAATEPTASDAPPTSDSDAQPDASSDADEEPAPDAYDAPTTPLDFEDCGDGFECAMFDVPLDYDDPAGDMTQIHVIRREATNDSIGPLFFNPGGPGFGAEEMVRGLGQFGPPPLYDNFDFIGIDPRGTGRSNPIDCNTDDEADDLRWLTIDPTEVEDYVADFEDLAATCEEKYGVDYLASITTENAARDMESVRLALGGELLNFYGASYGTALGTVYATMYPDSIRTMVLDAAVPTDPEDGTFETVAPVREEAVLRLDLACDLWQECAVRDVGLIEAVEQVREILATEGNIGNLDAATFNSAVGALYAVPFLMPDVAQGLAEALDGKGSLLAQIGAEGLSFVPDSERRVDSSGANQAIECADGWNLENSTVDELAGQAERTAAAAPISGPGWETPCDLWPVVGDGLPAASYSGDAPIMVIGAEGDAVTPFAWSEELADELGPNASLLVFEGTGHVTALRQPGCVDDHVFALFIDEVLPEDGSRCPAFGVVGIGYGDDLVIDRVTTGSPAEAAGLQLGDQIVEANGMAVFTEFDVPDGDLGEPLDLVVDRDGELLEFSVVRGPVFWEFWRLAE